jgi:MYXO-CTERM domain-containing protein
MKNGANRTGDRAHRTSEHATPRAHRSSWIYFGLTIACICASCSVSDTRAPGPGAGTEQAARSSQAASTAQGGTDISTLPAVSRPTDVTNLDLRRVMRQTHFAYRAVKDKPGEFEAAHGTYTVRVDGGAEPSVTLRPYRHPAREPGAGPPARVAPGQDRREARRRWFAESRPVAGDEMLVRTVSVSRSGAGMAAAAEAMRVDDEGALLIERAGVVERWSNDEHGVMQSWRFSDRPQGSGDLVVRVKPAGLGYAGRTAGGLHFAGASHGLGFRYGHGTWIDARDRRVPVAAEWVEGEIVLRVPASVVDGSAYPAELDPVIGTEFGMDNITLVQSAWLDQWKPRIAHFVDVVSTRYFVVWMDSRNPATGADLYGAFVNTLSGTVRPQASLAISTGVGDQAEPDVAFEPTNENYVVVWVDGRSGNDNVYAARVSAASETVLDPSGIAITTNTAAQAAPAVACDGTYCLVVWHDDRNGNNDVFGRRLNVNGTLADASDVKLVSELAGEQSNADLVWNPNYTTTYGAYAIAYQDNQGSNENIKATWTRRTTLSPLVTVNVSTATGTQQYPSIAHEGTGSNNYVVWEDMRTDPTGDIYGTGLDSTSGALVPGGRSIGVRSDSSQQEPRVEFRASTWYFAVWEDDRSGNLDIYGNRIQGGLTQDGSSGFAVATGTLPQRWPDLACMSTAECLVVWAEGDNASPLDVLGRTVKNDTQPQSVFRVSRSANGQQRPSVAFNGTDFLAVWADSRNDLTSAADIFGTRISTAGVVLDTNGIAISDEPAAQTWPDVACDGTYCLVAWSDGRNTSTESDIYGARVNKAGVVQDASGIPISTAVLNQHYPAVAWGSTHYMVVWQDNRASSFATDIYGTRVMPSGTVNESAGLGISTASTSQDFPDVAFDGANFLIVWRDGRNYGNDIYGARVVQSTGQLVSGDSAGKVVYAGSADAYAPAVAFDKTNYLVAWTRKMGSELDVYGARVSPAFVVQDGTPKPISTATDSQGNVAMAFDGYNTLVAWTDYRNRASTSQDIYGTWVSPSFGTLDPSTGLAVSTAAFDQNELAVAAADTGLILAVFRTFDATATTQSARVRAVRLARRSKVLGETCTANSNCVSDYCVDGVCCSTACSGNCDRCSGTGITRAGFCQNVPQGDPGSPSCGTYVCSGTSSGCPSSCTSDAGCSSTYYCAANGSCQPRKAQGSSCNQAAGADCKGDGCRVCAANGSCPNGCCVDGRCCNDPCASSCDVCAAGLGASADGTCTPAPKGYAGNPTCSPLVCTGAPATTCPAQCSGDADCIAGNYCSAAKTCLPRKAQGLACNVAAGSDCLVAGCRACTSTAGCPNGCCVDGFCCDKACGDSCDGCSSALTGGQNGTCAASKASSPGDPSCAPLVCNGTLTTCPTTCNNDGDCASSTLYCNLNDHYCHARKDKGQSCNAIEKCLLSQYCVDGVCCMTQCVGTCVTCDGTKNVSGTAGECGPVKDGEDPRNSCEPSDPNTCGFTGNCDGASACKYHGTGQVCLTPICETNVSKTRHCSGKGQCVIDPSGTDCGTYKCKDGVSCPTGCAGDGDCASSAYCSGNKCVPKLLNGTSCIGANQCASGNCVDDVCCDTACSGLCKACRKDLKEKGADDGVCDAAKLGLVDTGCGSPPPSQNTCQQNGTCDGKGGCRLWPSGTSCGASICDGLIAKAKQCDGVGMCVVATSGTDCHPYTCVNGECVGQTCQSDGECAAGYYCDSPPNGTCRSKKPDGQLCQAANQCASGYCVDGVCCNQACTGTCRACSSTKTGGSSGDCAAVLDGTDPDNDCNDGGGSSCQTDGQCDGAGACRLYKKGTQCGSAVCVGGDLVPKSCDGLGACVTDNPAGVSCAPYLCENAGCTKPCMTDAHCAAGHFCDAGECKLKKGKGDPCTAAAQCSSASCVDGVCCDTSCTNKCFACSAAAKASGTDSGTCGPAAGGADPHNDCNKDTAVSCMQDGECDGAGACRLYAAGSACGTTTCVGQSVKGKICDGFGACKNEPTGFPCSPFVCEGDQCLTSCTTDVQCAVGHYCDQNKCLQKGAEGATCKLDGHCNSAHCADGVCCDKACTGQCESCAEAGKAGKCTTVSGAPRGTRTPCTGQGTCAGTCDGQNASACKFPGSAVSCTAPCGGDSGTAKGVCDGKGACQTSGCAEAGAADAKPQSDAPGADATGPDAGESGNAGSPGAAGTQGDQPPAAAEQGGCGCRVPGAGSQPGSGWLAALLLAAGSAARRRRGRRAA